MADDINPRPQAPPSAAEVDAATRVPQRHLPQADDDSVLGGSPSSFTSSSSAAAAAAAAAAAPDPVRAMTALRTEDAEDDPPVRNQQLQGQRRRPRPPMPEVALDGNPRLLSANEETLVLNPDFLPLMRRVDVGGGVLFDMAVALSNLAREQARRRGGEGRGGGGGGRGDEGRRGSYGKVVKEVALTTASASLAFLFQLAPPILAGCFVCGASGFVYGAMAILETEGLRNREEEEFFDAASAEGNDDDGDGDGEEAARPRPRSRAGPSVRECFEVAQNLVVRTVAALVITTVAKDIRISRRDKERKRELSSRDVSGASVSSPCPWVSFKAKVDKRVHERRNGVSSK